MLNNKLNKKQQVLGKFRPPPHHHQTTNYQDNQRGHSQALKDLLILMIWAQVSFIFKNKLDYSYKFLKSFHLRASRWFTECCWNLPFMPGHSHISVKLHGSWLHQLHGETLKTDTNWEMNLCMPRRPKIAWQGAHLVSIRPNLTPAPCRATISNLWHSCQRWHLKAFQLELKKICN